MNLLDRLCYAVFFNRCSLQGAFPAPFDIDVEVPMRKLPKSNVLRSGLVKSYEEETPGDPAAC